MNLAIQTNLLPGDSLEAKFDAAARYGFDGVEINVGPNFDLDRNLSAIRSAMTSSGLPVSGICTHPIHDPFHADPDERQTRFERLAHLVGLAGELGAAGVVSVPVRPPVAFSGEMHLDDLAIATYSEWAALLPEGSAAVFLEPLNRYEATWLRRVGHAADLARQIGSPRVLALADLFHMNIEEADMGEPLRDAGPELGYVHMADNNRLQPGAGCLNFRVPFAALKEIGYTGWLSLECSALGGEYALAGPDVMLPIAVDFLRNHWSAA
jgi:sugar phosphate isomerase/epimerase